MDDSELEDKNKEPTCHRCGLRTYNSICPNCNIPIIIKIEKEDEDDDDGYDWRERR